MTWHEQRHAAKKVILTSVDRNGDPGGPARPRRGGRVAGVFGAEVISGSVALTDHQLGQAELMHRRPARVPAPRSGFAGYRFPPEVIMAVVRWYLRYGLSYRDGEELLAERGIQVDHVTVFRWGHSGSPHC